MVRFGPALFAALLFATGCGDDLDPPATTDADADGFDEDVDCDDSDAAVYPGADEACNGQDDDCDGDVDEAVIATWYADTDADGYGDPAAMSESCELPEGSVDPSAGEDCDDNDPAVHPSADETCNGRDDNCDGSVDEGVLAIWYSDADGDGYGDPDVTVGACEPPTGAVDPAAGEDCDDTEAAVHPSAAEQCNERDDDCDGAVDEDVTTTWHADADSDGYGGLAVAVQACEAPAGFVSDTSDCDDGDRHVHPGAEEDCALDVDRDCDGSTGYADLDGDGWAACEDCDDGDAQIHPEAAERCDGVDDDCDGAVDEGEAVDAPVWHLDHDQDGYGTSDVTAVACVAPPLYIDPTTPADCDDLDASVHPGAAESCDGRDADCDGLTGDDDPDATDLGTWYADADEDGFGNPEQSAQACVAPQGHVSDASDCDDEDPTAHPDATELCDNADQDCDGVVDEGVTATWYVDGDGDGYGDPAMPSEACEAPAGSVDPAAGEDCDDSDPAVSPAASEVCNGSDDDCDGSLDEDVTTTWYGDADADGYGVPGITTEACDEPLGYAAYDSDCDDADASVHPSAIEGCAEDIDRNCDGASGFTDGDEDGWAACEDCDDSDAEVHPDADERCTGSDDDCDGSIDEDDAVDAGTWYLDHDGDGVGDGALSAVACSAPTRYVSPAQGEDCDDLDAAVHPGAGEICSGVDDNCDGLIDDADPAATGLITWYADVDEDGYGDLSNTTQACVAPDGYVSDPRDCDDDDATEFPGATELCDGADDDCDGATDEGLTALWYGDSDEDGYGDPTVTSEACAAPAGTVDPIFGVDCDDDDPTVHPGATEQCGGGDEDCDGVVDEGEADGADTWHRDYDSDGFGDATVEMRACDQPAGYVSDATDCYDHDAAVFPGAADTWYDGVDADCGGDNDWDRDGDGYELTLMGDGDCDDDDPNIHPGATEQWYDGVDQDCDGGSDADQDGDGWDSVGEGGTDCDDTDAGYNPASDEQCDGVDNDCDGAVDLLGGSSLHFDGADDYVHIGHDEILNITDAITMEAWVFSQNPNSDEPVLAKEAGGGRQQYWFGVYNGTFGLLLGAGSDWGLQERFSGSIQADTWTHIASVWDGNTWTNYQDGVAVESGSYSTPIDTGDQPLTIGVNSGYDYTRFEGYIYDVRLFDVARSGEQIRDNMYELDDTSGLMGWWLLEEGSGQVAADSSGNGFHGRLGSTDTSDVRDPGWSTELPSCYPLYADSDADGYGDAADVVEYFGPFEGYVEDDTDCDDGDALIHPGMLEDCTGIDDDCDGDVDESGGISLHFDGAGDQVRIGDDPLLSITGAITMEAWVNPASPGGDEPVLAKEGGGGGQQYWFGVFHDRFGLLLGQGGGWGLYARDSGTIPAHTWTHIASTWDGSTWSNYQDGVLVDSGAYSTPMVVRNTPLTLGINSAFDNTAFEGNITDVRLYDVARSEAQIQANMDVLSDTSGLVGWWMLDDASGPIATDSGPNAFDGQRGNDAAADADDPDWAAAGPGCP